MGQTSYYKWSKPEYWTQTDQEGVNQVLDQVDAALHSEAQRVETSLHGEVSALQRTMNTALASRDTAIQAARTVADAKSRVIWGSYTGDNTQDRYISLEAAPKAVLLESDNGMRSAGTHMSVTGGLSLEGSPMLHFKDRNSGFRIDGAGFYVSYNENYQVNNSSYTYHYLALL